MKIIRNQSTRESFWGRLCGWTAEGDIFGTPLGNIISKLKKNYKEY